MLKYFFFSGCKPGGDGDDQTMFCWNEGEGVANLSQGGDCTAEMFDISIDNYKLHISESFSC